MGEIGFVAAGLVLLTLGGSLLVRGATQLAQSAGISPLIIGLTVVAFGTSAPEMGASVAAARAGQADIALGNVVGSNIFNVLFILGAAAVLAPPLVVAQRLVRVDVTLMIAVSCLLFVLGQDGRVSRLDAAGLFAGLVAYTAFCVRTALRESPAVRQEYDEALAPPAGNPGSRVASSLLQVVVGLGVLVVGSRWLVDGSTGLARAMGVSELVIGLTIVAAGTSLPEVMTSIVAARNGQRDIAVGNVVGSNLFNILGVLGLAGIVAPDGIPVATPALRFDVPVMIATAIACLPVFLRGHRIDRWEGVVFFGYYLAYTAFVVLDATDHDALPIFSAIMLAFVLPLTALTFAVASWRHVRANRTR